MAPSFENHFRSDEKTPVVSSKVRQLFSEPSAASLAAIVSPIRSPVSKSTSVARDTIVGSIRTCFSPANGALSSFEQPAKPSAAIVIVKNSLFIRLCI